MRLAMKVAVGAGGWGATGLEAETRCELDDVFMRFEGERLSFPLLCSSL